MSSQSSNIEIKVLLSVVCFSFGEIIRETMSPYIGRALNLLAGVYFVYLLITVSNKFVFSGLTYRLLKWLTLWVFILIVRLFIQPRTLGEPNLRDFLVNLFILPYFIPTLFLFYITKLDNIQVDFRRLFSIVRKMSLVSLLLLPFALYSMLNFQIDETAYLEKGGYQDFITNSTLHISAIMPPLLMIYFKKYMRKSDWYLYLGLTICSLFMSLYMARRGGIAITVISIISCFILYFNHENSGRKIKSLLYLALVLYVGFNVFESYSGSLFSYLTERADVDSRSFVEISYFNDMSLLDYIWGRGLYGGYYDVTYGIYRQIETGYLTLILRGGLLYLLPLVILLLSSSINALRKSRNLFVKSFAVINLIYVFELYPFGWPEFSLKFFFIWLGIYLCNNTYYLSLTDDEIKEKYFI